MTPETRRIKGGGNDSVSPVPTRALHRRSKDYHGERKRRAAPATPLFLACNEKDASERPAPHAPRFILFPVY